MPKSKLTASVTAIALVFSLAGCGDDGEDDVGTDNGTQDEGGGY